jgi:hypothetical protein
MSRRSEARVNLGYGRLSDSLSYQRVRPVRLRWSSLSAFGFYLLLSVFMTRPLLWRFNTHIPGWVWGDNAEYLWKLWRTKQALIDRSVSLLYAPHIFYPSGFSLVGGELTPAQTLLALPLVVAFGPVVAYNALAFASFVLTGFATYLLVTYLSRDRWAGLLSGVVFAFIPFRYQQFGNHLPLMGTQWIPLTFLFAERTLRTRRWRDAFLAGLFFALNVLSSWYYAAIVGLLLVVYLLWRTRPWREYLADRDLLICGLVAMLTVFVLVTPIAVPYLKARAEGNLTQLLSEADQWSASITDYFVPNPLHPLWGRYVVRYLVPTNELWRAFEFILFWGFGASLLALYGWSRDRRPFTRAVGLVLLVALVLSLGLTLHFHGRPVRLPVSGQSAAAFNGWMTTLTQRLSPLHIPYDLAADDAIAIPLPGMLLYLFVPPFGGIRVWSRFGVVAGLMVAVLAGLGLAAWRREQSAIAAHRRATIGSIFFVGLALFEFLTVPFGMVRPGPRLVDEWLAGQTEFFVVIQLPYDVALEGTQLYYSQYHGKPIASGYGSFFPDSFTTREEALRTFPADRSLDVLLGWGVRYVLLNRTDFPDWPEVESQIAAQSRLRLAYDDGDVRAYELTEWGP